MSSTLGVYLKISHNDVAYVVRLTCYHGVRKDDADPSKSNLFQANYVTHHPVHPVCWVWDADRDCLVDIICRQAHDVLLIYG
jgi:hypothetical protein